MASFYSLRTHLLFCGSFYVSATCYRRAEYVRVISVVITPFELGDVQRQVLAADFVETTHDAAFQERPESINRLSMDRAIDVLARAVPNCAVFLQFAISGIIVSRDQANFFRDGFTDEAVQSFCIGVFDDSGHYVALALDGAHNNVFAIAPCSRGALIPMKVSSTSTMPMSLRNSGLASPARMRWHMKCAVE
jgi:hypothetical protein